MSTAFKGLKLFLNGLQATATAVIGLEHMATAYSYSLYLPAAFFKGLQPKAAFLSQEDMTAAYSYSLYRPKAFFIDYSYCL